MSADSLPKDHFNLIIGATGSVASIKLEELINDVKEKFSASFKDSKYKLNICVLATTNAKKFIDNFDSKFNKDIPNLVDRLDFFKSNKSTSNDFSVFSFTDEDEWSSWSKRNDPVLHIELRKWADLLLIAPLDANSLAKLSNGMCDNLLTCVVRAWDLENIKSKPIIICPAMNTAMYKHPLTRQQLDLLVNQFGFTLVDSIQKKLMCGDTGIGAMNTLPTIIDTLFRFIRDHFVN